MAIGSVVGGHALLPLYDRWLFLVCAAPALISCLMPLVPSWYRRLDSKGPLAVAMLASEPPPDPS
jgi:hypothetical protein